MKQESQYSTGESGFGHEHPGQLTAEFEMTEEQQRAIVDLQNCYSILHESLMYCLQMGGKHVGPKHISLMLDTAELCKAGTTLLLHSSELSGRLAGVVAESCSRCATSLEQFGEDPQMKVAYDACHRAAESCRRLSGSTS